MTKVDHKLEIRFQVNPDNRVVSQVLSVTLSDRQESLRFTSAPCDTKSDATRCALIYIKEAYILLSDSTSSPYTMLTNQVEQLKRELKQAQEEFTMQARTVRQLQSEACDLRRDSTLGMDAHVRLKSVRPVLETILQHCEGKGWRSPDVVSLIQQTLESI